MCVRYAQQAVRLGTCQQRCLKGLPFSSLPAARLRLRLRRPVKHALERYPEDGVRRLIQLLL